MIKCGLLKLWFVWDLQNKKKCVLLSLTSFGTVKKDFELKKQ